MSSFRHEVTIRRNQVITVDIVANNTTFQNGKSAASSADIVGTGKEYLEFAA